MFYSTLLIVPWVLFGFKHKEKRYIGLNQTAKTIFLLLLIEVIYFSVLIIPLNFSISSFQPDESFSWTYSFVYEKGIFPFLIFNSSFLFLPIKVIDTDYKCLYLITAIIMDYIILKLFSPWMMNLIKILWK